MRLLLNEPVAIPPDRHGHGVYWLRIYSDDDSAVVIVTEVPGNPGVSITNNASRIARWTLNERLQDVTEIRWFYCYPKGAFGFEPTLRYAEVSFSQPDLQPTWHPGRVARKRIESLIGMPLALLVGHDEVLARVIAAGGSLTPKPIGRRYALAEVREMPPPMDPFRCSLYERFQASIKWFPRNAEDPYERTARNAFYAALATDDYKRCKRYHRGDWNAVCAQAVRIVEELGDSPEWDALDAAIDKRGLGQQDSRWLRSLFENPMAWVNDYWADGQHRGCAIRVSGAERTVVGLDGPRALLLSTWVMTGPA